jgi:16S rRNA (cytosine967-C5)-methyltransferase
MTPAARVQAAIDVFDLWQSAADGLDRVLAAWGRANRYAGSGDRRSIADLTYGAVRRLRSAAWVAGAGENPSGRDVMLGSLILDSLILGGLDIAAIFSGDGHAPQPLTPAETARLGQLLDAAPRAVRLDFPDWLSPHLEPVPDTALETMRRRAPLFLRVNLLRGDRAAAIAALAAEQIVVQPGPLSPTCLAVRSGAPGVARSTAYREGLVEVQDAASQAAADYAQATPRWHWPPPWPGKAASTSTTSRPGVWPSSTSGPGGRGSTWLPITRAGPECWPGAAIWFSSMPHAPVPGRGDGTRTPSGA